MKSHRRSETLTVFQIEIFKISNLKSNQNSCQKKTTATRKIEGTEAHGHPSHAIRAYTAPTNEDIFSTQYAVRGQQTLTTAPCTPELRRIFIALFCFC